MLIPFGNDPITDERKVEFAASLFRSTPGIWMYFVTQTPALNVHVTENSTSFLTVLRRKFISQYNQRMERDLLRLLHQRHSLAEYSDEFHNIILSIP